MTRLGAMENPDAPKALVDVVRRLGLECPWTRAQNSTDMIYWIRKELLEVEEVYRNAAKDSDKVLNREELTKELGDVLFDVLMLIEVTSRDQEGVTLQACTNAACAKIKKRCSYIDWESDADGSMKTV